MILARPDLAGLRGPTLARVYNVAEEDWYSVSLLVRKDRLLEAVDHLRDSGGVDISASHVNYLFSTHSAAYRRLEAISSQRSADRGVVQYSAIPPTKGPSEGG